MKLMIVPVSAAMLLARSPMCMSITESEKKTLQDQAKVTGK